MDNSLFKKFLGSARKNERVCYDPDFYIPYKEVLNQIYNDVSNLKYYTFDGRFDDILIKLTKTFLNGLTPFTNVEITSSV